MELTFCQENTCRHLTVPGHHTAHLVSRHHHCPGERKNFRLFFTYPPLDPPLSFSSASLSSPSFSSPLPPAPIHALLEGDCGPTGRPAQHLPPPLPQDGRQGGGRAGGGGGGRGAQPGGGEVSRGGSGGRRGRSTVAHCTIPGQGRAGGPGPHIDTGPPALHGRHDRGVGGGAGTGGADPLLEERGAGGAPLAWWRDHRSGSAPNISTTRNPRDGGRI